MEQKLNTCINLLTKAKELIHAQEPNIDLTLDMLEKSQEILQEFNEIPLEEKASYKSQLIEIQSLGQLINKKLAVEKASLQQKVLQQNKMSTAVKGYAKS